MAKLDYGKLIMFCKLADFFNQNVILHGRGQFYSARGAFNECKRKGDKEGADAIFNRVVNRKGKKVH